MENRRIINKILPCTLCPCKDGFWLPSLASANSGSVTQSAVCSPSVLGKHLPKVWLILSYLPLPDVIDQLFLMLCTSHRLQASCTTPICVGFLLGFFFLPAVTGSLHTIPLSYQLHSSNLPKDSM